MLRSRKVIVVSAVLLAIVLAVIAYMMIAMAPPSNLDLSRGRTTAKGLFAVEIAPENPAFERNTLHSWIVTVHTPAGEPVEDAQITVDGGMPQHGHGLPTAPQVTASLGEGRYRIEGVRFNMSGWWEFKLRVKAAAGEDDVIFNLSL
ncbi:FixH family protein [Mesorhizobium sp. J428]|uniref:FixH family protein n=1 Tax=Mesorhizobium sp. J428 TaxID=2898440 RepID=UPI002151064E|nr:FixH family protein [Mesorhizobium sp. J428]MCR5860084.1 FixH family protein [Mesorhizobium sp. J428]